VARHRIHERHTHRSRHSGMRDDAREVAAPTLVGTPESVRAAIQGYWADGLDAHTIADRLAYCGVTVQDVLAARYLNPG
jgi:alkanesulfonate monooxygenase SsuD/methylene tetrahydromethanopterin reductase-like flavin-dependent oxidoreductase (luciferase family)